MNDREWETCTDPGEMFDSLGSTADKRRCLLFAAACERRLWEQPTCERKKVEATERYADGLAGPEDLLAALEDIGIDGVTLESITEMDPLAWASYESRDSAEFAANVAQPNSEHGEAEESAWQAAFDAERAVQADLLRDIFRNPSRPPIRTDAAWLQWQGGLIRELARAIYEERRLPEGTLDGGRLAVLVDALEEAGCTDAEILNHLRRPARHVRGCWVLDLLLAMTGNARP